MEFGHISHWCSGAPPHCLGLCWCLLLLLGLWRPGRDSNLFTAGPLTAGTAGLAGHWLVMIDAVTGLVTVTGDLASWR